MEYALHSYGVLGINFGGDNYDAPKIFASDPAVRRFNRFYSGLHSKAGAAWVFGPQPKEFSKLNAAPAFYN